MKSELRKQSLQLISTSILLTSFSLLTGCGSGENGAPAVSSSAGQVGAVASLAWDPVQDPSVSGYYIHYGRNSAGQSGSCSYEDAQFVSSPNATITNLDQNTRYYFAVSAYNGIESACSYEVSTVTPASQA
jgi:hypothetical protein